MAPNRTEMLHFRATPEEKETICENAGHAELHLSEWMRQRSLDKLNPTFKATGGTDPDQPFPTQPVVEEGPVEVEREGVDWPAVRNGETYEQFMERRVPELLGQDVDAGDVESAQLQARAEWAAQES